jgi:hypothetical protein
VARSLALILVAAAVASGFSSSAAARDLGSVKFSFGAAPVSVRKGSPRSYFSLTVPPAAFVRDAVTISNGSATPQELAVSPSLGKTASISGYSYVDAFARCRGAACWIHGLPKSVIVPAKAAIVLHFTVSVPPGTPKRQYLAGISVQPAKLPQPVIVGRSAGIGAKAAVVTRVNVGVAITVGAVADLRTRLSVVGVRAVYSLTTPTLLIHERNLGETFVAARGKAICLDGSATHVYPVVSSLVLPAESAVLPVTALGLQPSASLHCSVSLSYRRGMAPSSWRGTVKLPSKRPGKLIQTGPHTFSQVPKPRVPRWAIGAIAGGAFLVVVLLVMVVVLLVRRRPTPTAP